MNPWLKGMALALHLSLAAGGAGAETADPRMQALMRKLDAGEAITIATVGGSITTGYAAQAPREKGWAALLAKSLKARLVNAGVSGTDSAAAVHRLQAQVLDAQPDLVIVEFGVNDEWLDPAVRASSYESLLRRLLSAPKAPAVMVLALTQQGNVARDAVEIQLGLARHYGLTALDFGKWVQGSWAALYDEPVHPNGLGHQRIAQAIEETLRDTAKATPAVVPPLPEPLYGRAHEFSRMLTGETLKPSQQRGFQRGGEAHPEWAGQTPGWTTTADDAEATFLVWGTEIAVFHAESEHYRNLEAWVDDGEPVTLRGQVPERHGYLGWHYSVVGRDLEPGAHLLHIRVKRDEWAGSGRPASFLAIMMAGLYPPALQPSDFVREAPSKGPIIRPGDPQLSWIGRSLRDAQGQHLSWSGTELRARFTGTALTLRMAPTLGRTNYFTVEIDGHPHVLALTGQGPADWRLKEPLPPGEHELRLRKRTEASQAESLFLGLRLSEGGHLLAPPAPRRLTLEFYGDSITAGACNGDMGTDQYEDLSTHDGTRAYGALTAERLSANYVGIAVSGIGITATWDQLLMPQVWNRYAPRLDAPVAPVSATAPDVVLINLGQNDFGFPHSQGHPMAQDFAERYLTFVRQLRARYPQARLVLLVGGMSAWMEEPRIPRGVDQAVGTLRSEGDNRVWMYNFKVFSWAHPRIDVHAQMADELVAFLRSKVLQ